MRTRRHAGRRGSKSKLRKVYWQGFEFSVDGVDVGGIDRAVATAWAKWPSGQRDLAGLDTEAQELVPNEETLVRTIVASHSVFPIEAAVPQDRFVTFVFGLIAWDAVDGTILQEALTTDGSVPDPASSPGLDWIIRIPFPYVSDNRDAFAIASEFITSRAMRKLPPDTGILMCWSCIAPLEPNTSHAGQCQISGRMCFKSGYYAA